jgi:hypothetical protein
MAWTLVVRSVTVNPSGAAERASTAARVERIRGLFRSTPPIRVAPIRVGSGSSSRGSSGRKPTSTQSSAVVNPFDHAGEPVGDLREFLEYATAA